jgi:hypothetical protein
MSDTSNISNLDQFTGSEQRVRLRLVHTIGVQDFAEREKCYWLINEISFVILPILLRKHRDWFYHLRFVVNADSSAEVIVDDGNGNDNILLTHKIKWTDFPLMESPIRFFLCESDNCYCLMLPSEY